MLTRSHAPARERAELLHAGAEPAVAGGGLRGRELARDAADLGGGDAAVARPRPRARTPSRACARRRDPATSPRAAPRSTSSSSNSVCTSASRNAASLPGRMKWCSLAIFAVSVRRGSITTILPPRSSTAAQAPRRVGHRHEAAVRDHRVRADDQQVLRAVDVGHGHGHRERPAEHEAGLHDLRQRVDRRGVELALRRERLAQHRPVQHARPGRARRDCRCTCRSRRCRAPCGSRAAARRPGRTPPARRSPPSRSAVRRTGRRRRSGSWCSSFTPYAFGQMKPRENGSALSPRTL